MGTSLPTASALLWQAAGRPETPDVTDASGPCWWCGRDVAGRGAPRSVVPDTFPDAPLAAVRASGWICAPCAWSIHGDAELPPGTTAGTLSRRLDAGGVLTFTHHGGAPQRALVLRLAGGRIGTWACGDNSADREPWLAEVKSLRENPRAVGKCAYLGDIDEAGIASIDRGAIRLYTHLGTASRWEALTADKSGRARMREVLLDPPREPWACVIGDGQKHCLPRGEVSDGRDPVQVVSLVGLPVHYEAPQLAAALDAWRVLLQKGAFDNEIVSGRYKPATYLVTRREEAIIAPLRRHPLLLELVGFLRESRTDQGIK